MVDSSRSGNGGVGYEPARDAVALMLSQAKTALGRGNWPLAEDRLARLYKAHRDDLEVARLLAQVIRERGRRAEAEALLVDAWKRSASAASDDALEARRDLVLELADLRLEDGRPAEAARALKKVLEVEPHQWEALYLLGNAFFDAGHYAEAEGAYRESLASNPFEAETWWNLAEARDALSDRAGLIEALEGWLGVAKDDAQRPEVEARLVGLRAAQR